MGEIDEPFDRECIRHFEQGDERPLIDFLNARLPTIGNGSTHRAEVKQIRCSRCVRRQRPPRRAASPFRI